MKDYDKFMQEVHDVSAFLLFIPTAQFPYVRVCKGTGDNLLNEDRSKGYVDYFDLEMYDLHIEVADVNGDYPPGFDYRDGGMAMYKSCVQDIEPEALLENIFAQCGVENNSAFVVLDTIF